MHSKVKLCSTWDHYPVYATIQENGGQSYLTQQKKNKGWAGWKPCHEDARNEFEKTVMDKKGDAQKEGLETIQRCTMGAKMITGRRFLFRPPIPVKITNILQKTPEFRENGHNDFLV